LNFSTGWQFPDSVFLPLSGRIAHLDQGHIVESGPPAANESLPNAIVTEFLATASEEPPPYRGWKPARSTTPPKARAGFPTPDSAVCRVGNTKNLWPTSPSAKTRFYFDKAREAAARDFEKIVSMKSQPAKLSSLSNPLPETGRIYLAIIVGGVAILLMILAEMKFFGT